MNLGKLTRRVVWGLRRRLIGARPVRESSLTLHGVGAAQLRSLLAAITIDGQGGLERYAEEDCERFMRTLDLIPAGAREVLEIGANPYFLTILARWFRPELNMSLTNFVGGEPRTIVQEAQITGLDGARQTHRFESANVNVEERALPFPDAAFDCVLFCEVIEHLLNNPLAALKELRRVLRPDGTLVLTTPNVARLENVARLMAGSNLYDPYSGHGPYGRHNREYTSDELRRLLQHAGFDPQSVETHDVHTNHAELIYPDLPRLAPSLKGSEPDRGQYIFIRARRAASATEGLPAWLYRSYPADQMAG